MMMPSTMILTICISMVLKRNCGLSLDIWSRYERAEHKTHNSTHKSQKREWIVSYFDIICTLCFSCWIGTGGVEADPPDKNFQSPVWGSSSTSGGVKPPQPPRQIEHCMSYLFTYLPLNLECTRGRILYRLWDIAFDTFTITLFCYTHLVFNAADGGVP